MSGMPGQGALGEFDDLRPPRPRRSARRRRTSSAFPLAGRWSLGGLERAEDAARNSSASSMVFMPGAKVANRRCEVGLAARRRHDQAVECDTVCMSINFDVTSWPSGRSRDIAQQNPHVLLFAQISLVVGAMSPST